MNQSDKNYLRVNWWHSSKPDSQKTLKEVTLLHATFFTFAKESGGLKEMEHGCSQIF